MAPVPPQTLPPEQGLEGTWGTPLSLPDLDWPCPTPTAWQLGPQPPRSTASPPGKRPLIHQNCLPNPLGRIAGLVIQTLPLPRSRPSYLGPGTRLVSPSHRAPPSTPSITCSDQPNQRASGSTVVLPRKERSWCPWLGPPLAEETPGTGRWLGENSVACDSPTHACQPCPLWPAT